MSLYPFFLKLSGEHCLVFGGGDVATRKVKTLLKCRARVTCISKDFSKELKRLADVGARSPRPSGGETPPLQLKQIRSIGAIHKLPLRGTRIVIAATSDRSFNLRIFQICRRKKILVNIVDDPELCDFYAPAVLERGPLQVAISTGGTSPLFAKRLREELEKVIPPATGKLLGELGKARRRLIERKKAGK